MSIAPSTALRSAGEAIARLWTGASGWVGTRNVARRLGYTPRRVRQLIEEGKIPATRFGNGQYKVPLEWLTEQIKSMTAGIIRRKPGKGQ